MTGAFRTTKHFWTDKEFNMMLSLLKEMNILKCMDRRKMKNGDLYQREDSKDPRAETDLVEASFFF